jgi:hypothetical protein
MYIPIYIVKLVSSGLMSCKFGCHDFNIIVLKTRHIIMSVKWKISDISIFTILINNWWFNAKKMRLGARDLLLFLWMIFYIKQYHYNWSRWKRDEARNCENNNKAKLWCMCLYISEILKITLNKVKGKQLGIKLVGKRYVGVMTADSPVDQWRWVFV